MPQVKSKKAQKPFQFIVKLGKMLDDETLTKYIAWNKAGNTFQIINVNDFTQKVLSSFFRQSKFQSFVRQLNIYGFHKIHPLRWEFSHPRFLREEPELRSEIVRNKSDEHNKGPSVRRKSVIQTEIMRCEAENDQLRAINMSLVSKLEDSRKRKRELVETLGFVVDGLKTISMLEDQDHAHDHVHHFDVKPSVQVQVQGGCLPDSSSAAADVEPKRRRCTLTKVLVDRINSAVADQDQDHPTSAAAFLPRSPYPLSASVPLSMPMSHTTASASAASATSDSTSTSTYQEGLESPVETVSSASVSPFESISFGVGESTGAGAGWPADPSWLDGMIDLVSDDGDCSSAAAMSSVPSLTSSSSSSSYDYECEHEICEMESDAESERLDQVQCPKLKLPLFLL